ncbi:MAG: hypothetical protein RJA49_313, partial [Actinomycetota bacterium]
DVLGSFTGATAPLSSIGTFRPLAARRVVDTRRGLGFARLAANGVGSVNPSVVPNTALGVVQNIVVVRPAGRGVVTAYPAGAAVPAVTNAVVTRANQTRSTNAITRPGGGAERFRTTVATDLVVDVSGWFVGA